ncbi:hypothetical protein D3C81_1064070 [compost metagenome]
MLGQTAFGLQAFGFTGIQCSAGAIHRQAEIVRLQAHQQVALGYVLVILNQHFIDACAELAGNPGDFALNIGVVGTFVEAPLEEPVGEKGEGNQQNQGQENQEAAFELSGHEYYRSKNVSKFNRVWIHRHKCRSRPLLEPGARSLLTSSL